MNKNNSLFKKVMSGVLAGALVFSSFPVYAANDSLEEKEPNDTKEAAQEISFPENQLTRLKGSLSSKSDEDWYKITLPDPGRIQIIAQGATLTAPSVDIFSTTYAGEFGHVLHYEGLSDNAKRLLSGSTFSWYNHLPNNEVFVRVSHNDRMPNNNYNLDLNFIPNSIETDPHEPNTVFNLNFNYYETTPIQKNKLITSKWNSASDYQDVFSIDGNGTKGLLSFEVHHTQNEIDQFDPDSSASYMLFAEMKDGGYKQLGGVAGIGKPNLINSKAIEVDNDNYTGKYALAITKSVLFDQYKVKLNFEDASSDEEKPEVPGEPEDTPDAPLTDISNLKKTENTASTLGFSFNIPKDSRFSHVNVYRNNNKVKEVKNNSFKDTSLTPNTKYTYTFKTVDKSGNESKGKTITATTEKYVERISGHDRYKTSAAFLNKLAADSLDSVFVASGKDFPDSLAGSVLNNSYNGVVTLITNNNKIINDKIEEIHRVLKSNGKVYILGGEIAVSKNIENKLSKEFQVERINGRSRVETSIEIAKKVNNKPTEIFITDGMEFADSLSITPYATKHSIPVILNTADDKLSNSIVDYLKSNKSIQKVTIIGGEIAFSKNAEDEVRKYINSVERINGANRELTSLEIAKKFYPNSQKVAISNGYDFPDSLSGSQFAYKQDMPILLVQSDKVRSEVQKYAKSFGSYYLYGGETALTNKVINQLK